MKLPVALTRAFTARLAIPTPVALTETVSTGAPLVSSNFLGNISDLFSSLSSGSLQYATASGVRGLPAAWKALNQIGHACGVMMDSAKVFDGDDSKPAAKPLLIADPNTSYDAGAYQFYKEMTECLILHGNYFAVKAGYDSQLNATQLIPVDPLSVDIEMYQGVPVYKVQGIERPYWSTEMVHIRGLTVPGQWRGIGVIEALRAVWVASIDMQTYSHTTYRTGSVPSMAIVIDKDAVGNPMSVENLTSIRDQFIAAHGAGHRLPVVLGKGMSLVPMTWTPEDTQFIEARQFNIAETAFAFGMDPTDLSVGLGVNNTYANIEQRNIERIFSSYSPWTMRIEKALSRQLPGQLYVKANPEALLRTDVKTRYEAHQIALQNNFLTIDEVRAIENRPPLQAA